MNHRLNCVVFVIVSSFMGSMLSHAQNFDFKFACFYDSFNKIGDEWRDCESMVRHALQSEMTYSKMLRQVQLETDESSDVPFFIFMKNQKRQLRLREPGPNRGVMIGAKAQFSRSGMRNDGSDLYQLAIGPRISLEREFEAAGNGDFSYQELNTNMTFGLYGRFRILFRYRNR